MLRVSLVLPDYPVPLLRPQPPANPRRAASVSPTASTWRRLLFVAAPLLAVRLTPLSACLDTPRSGARGRARALAGRAAASLRGKDNQVVLDVLGGNGNPVVART